MIRVNLLYYPGHLHGHMRSHCNVIAVAITAALFAGCTSVPNTLPPEAMAKVAHTQARCYFPQSTAAVQYMRSGYGAGLGLIGAIVDISVTSAMSSSAEDRANKLQQVLSDYDLRSHYWNTISNVLREVSWLRLAAIDFRTSGVIAVEARDLENGSMMNLGTDYKISADMRVLQIDTGIGFYVPGKWKSPSAAILMTYHSARIGEEEGDSALELWTANKGEAYRRAAAEGIAESARMLRHAFNIMKNGTQSYEPARIRAKLLHARGDYGIPSRPVKLKGFILEKTADRVLFKVEPGAIYSFPLGEVELNY